MNDPEMKRIMLEIVARSAYDMMSLAREEGAAIDGSVASSLKQNHYDVWFALNVC
jgi:hypothetical protein